MINLKSNLIQSVFLFGSLVCGMGFGLVSTVLITREIPPVSYGELKFIVTIWLLLNVISSVGIFHSTGQLLLQTESKTEMAEIIGTILVFAGLIGLLCSVSILLLAPTIDYFFKTSISHTMILLAPLMIIYPIKDAITLSLQSINKIYSLSVLNFFPPLLFLSFIFIGTKFIKLDLITILLTQQLSFLFVLIIIIYFLKPKFSNLLKWFRTITKYQKSYGLPVYIALLCGVATQQINRIAIVFWVNSEAIGFFSLASQLVEPLRMIPSSVATSSFRSFAQKVEIPRKLINYTLIVTLLSFAFFIVLFGKPLSWVLPAEYSTNVGPMSKTLAIGAIILGFAELINRFLGANGKGNDLKLTAYVFGIIYVVGFLVFTPLWGVWGTIASTILANIVNLTIMLFFYFRYRKTAIIEKLNNGIVNA